MIDTEGLKQKYSPDGSSLRILQLKMLEEVRILDKICKENGLTYYLSSGTALGAVRHQGFIPWDDDMDIALPEKDYCKLVSILRHYKSEKYVLHDCCSDFNYISGFPKFREKEGALLGSFPARGKLYKYQGAGVDIFCVSRNSFLRAFVCAKMRVALLHYMFKIRNDTVRKVVTKVQWLVYQCLVPLTWPLNVFRKKGELHYGLGQGYAKHFMWEQEVFPVTETLFESQLFPVPNNADAYLTHVYGNWRQVPDEQQIAETVHNRELIDPT
ncbi:MAG: LicD family protein [Bacteroidales bacterium]|nr:LicD family protein [Bacteroidales bacterium]